jgi:Rieske Fe-S protein
MSEPNLSRRRALGVAIGGLSLPLLAACGSGSSTGGAASTSPPPSAPPSGSTKGGAPVLVAANKVPVGGGIILADENVTVTQPTKGTFEGFSATCTHQGCLLANVAGGTINCGCHGSQFSIKNGANVTGPLGEPAGSVPPLPKVQVTVKGPNIVMG